MELCADRSMPAGDHGAAARAGGTYRDRVYRSGNQRLSTASRLLADPYALKTVPIERFAAAILPSLGAPAVSKRRGV